MLLINPINSVSTAQIMLKYFHRLTLNVFQLATARTPINLDLEEEYHQELLTDQDDPGHEQEEFHNRSLVPARHHLLQ